MGLQRVEGLRKSRPTLRLPTPPDLPWRRERLLVAFVLLARGAGQEVGQPGVAGSGKWLNSGSPRSRGSSSGAPSPLRQKTWVQSLRRDPRRCAPFWFEGRGHLGSP